MELAEHILRTYKNEIESLTIIPSSGGVFEVISDDKLIFSKKEMKRFPEIDDIDKNL